MNEINMTPLVDVMLVLLIIFLVTIPAIQHAVKVDLPHASSQPEDVKPSHITVSVNADGSIYWDDRRASDDALQATDEAAIINITAGGSCSAFPVV